MNREQSLTSAKENKRTLHQNTDCQDKEETGLNARVKKKSTKEPEEKSEDTLIEETGMKINKWRNLQRAKFPRDLRRAQRAVSDSTKMDEG